LTFLRAPLIGLSGWARSGKDTAAEALTADGWDRLAFADTLRSFLLALDPLIPITTLDLHGEHIEHRRISEAIAALGWDTAKEAIPEVRELLQRCGTEAGRKVLGSNTWVDATLGKMRPGVPTVITDVRFVNEADSIRLQGGVVLRVTRPGIEAANDHESEHALDDYVFDWHLINDGTVDDLHTQARHFVRDHIRPASVA